MQLCIAKLCKLYFVEKEKEESDTDGAIQLDCGILAHIFVEE